MSWTSAPPKKMATLRMFPAILNSFFGQCTLNSSRPQEFIATKNWQLIIGAQNHRHEGRWKKTTKEWKRIFESCLQADINISFIFCYRTSKKQLETASVSPYFFFFTNWVHKTLIDDRSQWHRIFNNKTDFSFGRQTRLTLTSFKR